MLWIGIDVGGTFTDAVVYDTQTSAFRLAKAPSTPADPTEAVLDVLTRDLHPVRSACRINQLYGHLNHRY